MWLTITLAALSLLTLTCSARRLIRLRVFLGPTFSSAQDNRCMFLSGMHTAFALAAVLAFIGWARG